MHIVSIIHFKKSNHQGNLKECDYQQRPEIWFLLAPSNKSGTRMCHIRWGDNTYKHRGERKREAGGERGREWEGASKRRRERGKTSISYVFRQNKRKENVKMYF